MRFVRLSIGAAAAGIFLLTSSTVSAQATEPTVADEAIEALQDLTSSTTDPSQAVLEDSVTSGADEEAGVAASISTDSLTIDVPIDPADGIQITGDSDVTIGLPFADQASSAQPTEEEGVVVYDNGNGSATAPVLKEEGAVQITTVVSSSAAPQRYDYPIEIPGDGSAYLTDEALIILDAQGDFAGGIAPPWATDAEGTPVPTHFEYANGTLTQVVLHDDSYAYPIVADPYHGKDLLKYANVKFVSKGAIVNTTPTAYGRKMAAPTIHSYHVAELKQRLGPNHYHRVDNKQGTIREQFLCHVFGNAFEPGEYNMEDWRPSKHWALQLNLVDQCNPT